MKALVIMNAEAGGFKSGKWPPATEIERLFRERGIEARIKTISGERISETAAEAASAGANMVVAAGGDGTVHSVAQSLVRSNMPLGILPLGTLNHFAKDLEIPLHLKSAIDVLRAGNLLAVDAGSVNGRTFINNSSLGVYAEMVAARDDSVAPRWPAMMTASLKTLIRFPKLRVRLSTGAGEIYEETPFVFVGNNEYELDPLNLGRRRSLTGGKLCLYLVKSKTRAGLFLLAWRGIFNRLDQSRDFENKSVEELWIENEGGTLKVAMDGEISTMSTPLHYSIIRRALSVICPPAKP